MDAVYTRLRLSRHFREALSGWMRMTSGHAVSSIACYRRRNLVRLSADERYAIDRMLAVKPYHLKLVFEYAISGSATETARRMHCHRDTVSRAWREFVLEGSPA